MNQTFKIGEEVTCKLDGNKAYIVERFSAVMVSFEGKLKVIPQRYIVELEKREILFRDEDNLDFKKGRIVDKKSFYVVHLANGQLKIATSEILLKGHQKVIPVFSGKSLIKPN